MVSYAKYFNEVLSQETNNEQELAGVKVFEQFGVFNIVDALAQGDVLRWDAVLQIECATVLIKMKLDQERNKFEQRLQKVYDNKRKNK